MSNMVEMQIVLPEKIHQMLIDLVDEFQEETRISVKPDAMIAGTIQIAYGMRH